MTTMMNDALTRLIAAGMRDGRCDGDAMKKRAMDSLEIADKIRAFWRKRGCRPTIDVRVAYAAPHGMFCEIYSDMVNGLPPQGRQS